MIAALNATPKSASAATYRTLSNLGWKPEKDGAFIKPNIGATSKKANTSPEIVRGLVRYLKDRGIKDVLVGEGAVETEYESTPYNFNYCGWYKLAEEEGFQLADLNEAERVEIPWHYGKVAIPKVMLGRSYVNVCKLKTHMQTLVSLCLKNQKGLLTAETRKRFHLLGLHEPIAHLADAIKPELCLVDAIIGIEGNGPGDSGRPPKVGMVIAGDDIAQVDRLCCRVMGIDPDRVEHIRIASKGAKDDFGCSGSYSFYFKPPDDEFRMFNVHMKAHETACTACMSSVGKMNKLARRRPEGVWFFFNHGIRRRLDIIVGNPDKLPDGHGECVFYGNCTARIARAHPEYPFIEGCPPVSKDALHALTRSGK